MLAQIPNFEVVIEAANGKALLDKIVGTRPDVVLLDMDMPVMNGETTANYLLQHYSNIRIILLTLDRRHPALPNLLKTGVSGFVYKGADLDEFECAIWEFVPHKQYWQKYQ